MRFFTANKMKEIIGVATAATGLFATPVLAYVEFKKQQETEEAFRKQYPNAHVYFKPHPIAGMGGANDVIAEDKRTGKILAQG